MKNSPVPVSIDDPKTWVKYKPSLCDGCFAGCCTFPVQVTSEDLYQMGFLEAHQVNGPLKRIAAKLIRQGIIASYRDRTRLFTLKQRDNNDCVFLGEKDRLCTLYERRPFICRRFPESSARPGYCPTQRK